MKLKIILFALSFISAASTFAQKRIVENAKRDALLVTANGAKVVENKTAYAVANQSSTRTISVRLEEAVITNNYLEKKVIAVEKIGPNQQKFVGYSGCDTNVLGTKCIHYKIALAYYDDAPPVPAPIPQQKITQGQVADEKKITAK